MEESLVLALFAALAWLWWDSMSARERAVSAGKATCERDGLQFLDDTVECVSLRPGRNAEGRLALRRTYRFEFSDDGANRRAGSVSMLGARVESIDTEPYLIQ
ncbi:MAG: DUF3301 domain-containing protein [Proteobacteria bacterium]|nr:DUF3301 domain-containing protein [Pseudomonadota bacterium]